MFLFVCLSLWPSAAYILCKSVDAVIKYPVFVSFHIYMLFEDLDWLIFRLSSFTGLKPGLLVKVGGKAWRPEAKGMIDRGAWRECFTMLLQPLVLMVLRVWGKASERPFLPNCMVSFFTRKVGNGQIFTDPRRETWVGIQNAGKT